MLKEIFENAKKYGIKRGAIGIEVFGRKDYARIYRIINPTAKTLEKIKKAVEKLKNVKKNENN